MRALSFHPRRQHGSALLLLVIVLAVIGGGWFFLNKVRHDSEAEGQRFAREVIDRCAVQHDVKFLQSAVAADRRLAIPPGMDQQFVDTLAKLGVPDRNYQLTGTLQFENYFLSPHGTYNAVLTYPDRRGTLFVAVARPSGIWLVTDYGITWERPPE